MKEIKILLVDDEENFVKTLSERIQLRDQAAEVALNGEQALKRFHENMPDVMVLDLKMPGMDGLEVLRRVKETFPQVPVIILTGRGTEEDEKEARRLGAFDYLRKPVEIEALMKHIRRAYKSKIEGSLTAATFAEAGEFETAKDVMRPKKEK
ncbi:MAG: response regulator [Desulfobacteraceae bacterium]|nr:MAG: response regulator [Desulfobacteraceae bacterium]